VVRNHAGTESESWRYEQADESSGFAATSRGLCNENASAFSTVSTGINGRASARRSLRDLPRKNGALPFQITLQELALRDLRGLDQLERLVTKDGPPTVQQLPISQDLRKGDEVDSLSGIPNRACLPHLADDQARQSRSSRHRQKLPQMRLPPAAARSLTD
jgi:hypothetical protein